MLLLSVYRRLLKKFGKQEWWPAGSPFEVAVGAVLTQNTSWGNVEKAIANLRKAEMLSAEKIANAQPRALEKLIRPSGFYRQKAGTLRRVAEFFVGFDFHAAHEGKEIEKLRAELLKTKGVGKETADSILLYALNLPVFVIDAYTIRFCERHGILKNAKGGKRDYEVYRKFFERNLPRDARIYNEFLALLVKLAKEKCLKREARCACCPIKAR